MERRKKQNKLNYDNMASYSFFYNFLTAWCFCCVWFFMTISVQFVESYFLFAFSFECCLHIQYANFILIKLIKVNTRRKGRMNGQGRLLFDDTNSCWQCALVQRLKVTIFFLLILNISYFHRCNGWEKSAPSRNTLSKMK